MPFTHFDQYLPALPKEAFVAIPPQPVSSAHRPLQGSPTRMFVPRSIFGLTTRVLMANDNAREFAWRLLTAIHLHGEWTAVRVEYIFQDILAEFRRPADAKERASGSRMTDHKMCDTAEEALARAGQGMHELALRRDIGHTNDYKIVWPVDHLVRGMMY